MDMDRTAPDKEGLNSSRQAYVMDILRASGCRITHQRETIVRVILTGEHSTTKEIYNVVRKMDPNVGFATVYRMVSLLEQLGVISRGIVVNYEVMDS